MNAQARRRFAMRHPFLYSLLVSAAITVVTGALVVAMAGPSTIAAIAIAVLFGTLLFALYVSTVRVIAERYRLQADGEITVRGQAELSLQEKHRQSRISLFGAGMNALVWPLQMAVNWPGAHPDRTGWFWVAVVLGALSLTNLAFSVRAWLRTRRALRESTAPAP